MAEQSVDPTAKAKALPLLVASDDPAVLDAVHALVADTEPPVELTPLHPLDAALAQDAEAPVLVPLRLPFDHLRMALQAGETPADVLDAWCNETEALLQSCRKARRRVVMIDAGMLTARPSATAEALGARLGLRFKAIAEGQAAPTSGLACIHSAIAASLLAMDVRAMELADELESMIVGPIAPRTPSRDEISTAAQEVASFAEERDLLRENLSQMLSEVEEMRDALSRREEETSKLEAARAESVAALGRAREETEALRRERDAATARATQLEEKLSQADAARHTLTEERDLLRENLSQMLSETERLIAEKSDESEKYLLKAQLDAVTRQLEEAQERRAARESVLGTEILQLAGQARAERDKLAAELHAANQEAAQLKATASKERDRLTAELEAARDEIARILASSSWKITKPMRAVRRGLTRP